MTTQRETHTEFDCMALAEVPEVYLDAMLWDTSRASAKSGGFMIQASADYNELAKAWMAKT